MVLRRGKAERGKAEKTVRESEQRFEAMANGIPQLAWMAESDGSISWFNQRWFEWTGTTFEEARGWGWQSILDPQLRPRVLEMWKSCIARGEAFEMESPLREADGRIRIHLTRARPHRDGSGKLIGWFGTHTDISERMRTEEQLAQQAEEISAQAGELARSRNALETQSLTLQSILDSLEEGLVVSDAQGKFVIWNAAAERILGLGAANLPVDKWSQHYGLYQDDTMTPFPAEQLPLWRAIHGEASRAQIFVRNPELREGVWIDISAGPLKSKDGTVRGGVAAFRDVTRSKAAEREIRQLNEELEQRVVERTAQLQAANKELTDQRFAIDQHAIVAVTNAQGIITYANDKFCAVSQYSREELIGNDHRIIKSGHHSNEYFQQMYRTITRGEVWHGEVLNRAKDGSLFWLDTTIVPFCGKDGRPQQYIAIRADITTRKQAEERVAQRTAQLEAANQELEAFTYSVSHDLRAPLRHISGFSNLLAEECGSQLDARAQHYVERIAEGTRQMGQLVDELLNLSRVGRAALAKEVSDLNALVAEVVAMLAPEATGRRIEWRISDLPCVECDRILTKQVFQNLLANAIKFTRPRPQPVIEVSHGEEAGEVVITVRDNGVGFSMKNVEKLFGVFQRLHRGEDFEGTGVGLATVQRIVQRHGGRVWAEAEPEKGATFYFTLGTGAAEPATAALGPERLGAHA